MPASRAFHEERWADASPETDAKVASLRGGKALPYSTDMNAAWELFAEIEKSDKCSVAVMRTMWDGDPVYECSVCYSYTHQSHEYVRNGFGPSAAAAICATYIRLVSDGVAEIVEAA